MLDRLLHRRAGVFAALAACALAAPALAQDDPFSVENRPDFPYPTEPFNAADYVSPNPPENWSSPPLGEGPFDLQSWEQRNYRVTVVARGLVQPRSLHFLPNGDLLVSEIEGRLRLIRDGVLRPEPVAGIPTEIFNTGGLNGFRDIALHPDFETNGWIYFSYDKPAWGGLRAPAVWRGRWTGEEVADGADIFVADDVGAGTSRIEFGADGKLYMTIGAPAIGPEEGLIRAQHLSDYAGKVVRLNDDGGIPEDGAFVGQEGVKPTAAFPRTAPSSARKASSRASSRSAIGTSSASSSIRGRTSSGLRSKARTAATR